MDSFNKNNVWGDILSVESSVTRFVVCQWNYHIIYIMQWAEWWSIYHIKADFNFELGWGIHAYCSVCLSVCLSVYLFKCMSLSVCLPLSLAACLFLCLSVILCIRPSIRLCLPISLSLIQKSEDTLSVSLSVLESLSLSVSLIHITCTQLSFFTFNVVVPRTIQLNVKLMDGCSCRPILCHSLFILEETEEMDVDILIEKHFIYSKMNS